MANENRSAAKQERQRKVRAPDKGMSRERCEERELERGVEHERLPDDWRACA